MVNLSALCIGITLAFSVVPLQAEATVLDLQGFSDTHGALSVQYHGDTVDPYFALQALLLAHDNGLDIASYAMPWVDWLVRKQKPDATFDRYCRNGPVWAPCKTADADDAMLALWLRLLDTMPLRRDADPALRSTYAASQIALRRLLDPQRGIYLVSPVYQHGLFMDNLEVLSWKSLAGSRQSNGTDPSAQQLRTNMEKTFWDPSAKAYLVSTQPEQRTVAPAFYPESVAQVLPLLFDFRIPGMDSKMHYRNWMRIHRATWLAQSKHDFSWGLLAIIALRAGDLASAGCWLRETTPARHSSHWIVTDEVARQILHKHDVKPATAEASCL